VAIQERNRDGKPLDVAATPYGGFGFRPKSVWRKALALRCLLTAPKGQLLSLSVKFVSLGKSKKGGPQ
jgi:hypothetical protein